MHPHILTRAHTHTHWQTVLRICMTTMQEAYSKLFVKKNRCYRIFLWGRGTFPYSAQEQRNVKEDFLHKTGFPNVIGTIDCTHVAIRAPHVNEYVYINGKHLHSINVQLICDAHMAILNAVARWPGSTHDSFVVRNCSVGNRLEAGAGRNGWLLGKHLTLLLLKFNNTFYPWGSIWPQQFKPPKKYYNTLFYPILCVRYFVCLLTT